MDRKPRVLVVDDSAFMRHIISKLLTEDGEMEVVDTARDGLDALQKLDHLEVDVITMDVEMPKMDGLTALGQIMNKHALPVVMVSSATSQGAKATVRALSLGAIDFVCKPSGAISLNMQVVKDELLLKVKQAAQTKPHNGARSSSAVSLLPLAATTPRGSGITPPIRVLAIGSSTGGPKALHQVVSRLSGDLPVPIVIVQHMPPGFTKSLAEHLNDVAPVHIREASHGDVLRQGQALVAPGNYHMTIGKGGTVALNQEPQVHGVRPSVDVTLNSLAETYGSGCLAIILTGMGSDGALGALRIRNAGGRVLAEHESTCVVYGMPKSAIENGAAERAIPLPQMAYAIEQIVRDGKAQ